MDVDPIETVDNLKQPNESGRLNTLVAVMVACLATFMGVCKVKDDNICQAMQQAQADKIDHWAFYQARNLREEMAKSTSIQLRLAQPSRPKAEQEGYQQTIAHYDSLAVEQATKKHQLQKQAEEDQKTYDTLNFRDDQFDLSDALLAISISLLAITALTQKKWLFFATLLPVVCGVLMGLAGLCGWHLHPTALTALLS